MGRPARINTNPVASRYDAPNERTAEFEGGLISLRRQDDGRLIVSLYRLDPNVTVYVSGVFVGTNGNAVEVAARGVEE